MSTATAHFHALLVHHLAELKELRVRDRELDRRADEMDEVEFSALYRDESKEVESRMFVLRAAIADLAEWSHTEEVDAFIARREDRAA